MNRPLKQPVRRRSPHGRRNRAGRAAWGIVYLLLFRHSPRTWHWWRAALLRLFGADVHRTVRVYGRARIWAPWNLKMAAHATIADDVDVYCVDRISLGERAVVSQYCYLCSASHDYEAPGRPLSTAPIVIGAETWLAADVFVAPGVTIGDRTVVGARSSVFSDLPPATICYGTPAKPVRPRRIRGEEEVGEGETVESEQVAL